MEQLSEIAKVYLDDIEVITEGQQKLVAELGRWWEEIIDRGVMADLKHDANSALMTWSNKNQPGQVQLWLEEKQSLRLQILDPRYTGRPFYTVRLQATSKPTLKKIASDKILKDELDRLAEVYSLGEMGRLKWNSTFLAEQDVDILHDDPDDTGKQLRDLARRYFSLVIAESKAT